MNFCRRIVIALLVTLTVSLASFGFVNVDVANASRIKTLCNKDISLLSWKGDYLHRPDSAQGVTTWGTGIGNKWTVECIKGKKHTIQLKSWKGDYLHRPDSDQGVTTWNTGIGNEWVVKPIADSNGKIELGSWKGDSLHRPDSAQGVTTWSTGIGNQWIVVLWIEGKKS